MCSSDLSGTAGAGEVENNRLIQDVVIFGPHSSVKVFHHADKRVKIGRASCRERV